MRTDACRAAFRTVLLVVVAACAGLPAYAQSARLQITGLEKLASKAAEVVDVTLDGPMLKLASKFIAADEDPDADKTLALIKDLKGIYVKSFEFEREGEYSPEDVEAIRAQLHAPGWVRIVGVHSKRERENTDVYLMSAGSEKAVQGCHHRGGAQGIDRREYRRANRPRQVERAGRPHGCSASRDGKGQIPKQGGR